MNICLCVSAGLHRISEGGDGVEGESLQPSGGFVKFRRYHSRITVCVVLHLTHTHLDIRIALTS